MNINVALRILQLAISLVQILTAGATKNDTDLARILSDIVGIAARAYQAQVGQPIDPSLISAESSI